MPSKSNAFSTLITGLPNTEASLLYTAQNLLKARKFDKAQELIERALREHPSIPLHLSYARIFIEKGEASLAIPNLISLLRENDESVEVLLALVESLIECADYTRARKMLIRAESLNAPQAQRDRLNQRLESLEGHTDKISRDIVEKRSTVLGLPTSPFSVSDPLSQGSAHIEQTIDDDHTVESGTFADLVTYVVNPETGEYTKSKLLTKSLGDQNFDSMIGSLGVKIPKPPSIPKPDKAIIETNAPFSPTASGLFTSAPRFDDVPPIEDNDTLAVVLKELTDPNRKNMSKTHANPNDVTGHLTVKDVDLDPNTAAPYERTEHILMRDSLGEDDQITSHMILKDPLRDAETIDNRSESTGFVDIPTIPVAISDMSLPRQSFEPQAMPPSPPLGAFVSPPSDLDSLPNFNAAFDDSGRSDSIPFSPSLDSIELAPPQSYPQDLEPPGIPQSSEAPHQQPAPLPKPVLQQDHSEFALRPVEVTTYSSNHVIKKKKKWPMILGATFLAFVILSVSLVGFSSYLHSSKLKENLSKAHSTIFPDDYNAYLSGRKTLKKGLSSHSILGEGFDHLFGSILPLEALRSSSAKREHLALSAYIDTLLEARFENLGSRDAASSLKAASKGAPENPYLAAASALNTFSKGKPYKALNIAAAAKAKYPNASVIDEVRILILMSLGEKRKTFLAGKKLRKKSTLTPRQQYYSAISQSFENTKDARIQFSELLERNPKHIDAIIDRSFLLRDGASELERAEKELHALPREASQYQVARASLALGYVALSKKDNASAEELFKTAIQKMPGRNELYRPLLDFYVLEGRYDDAKHIIKKAKKTDSFSSQLSLINAELLIMSSEYQTALDTLETAAFSSPEKDWLSGLALFHQNKLEKAIEAFDAAKKLDSEFPEPIALKEVARVMLTDSATEDAIHQLERLKERFPNNAFVLYSLSKVLMKDGTRTTSENKRDKRYHSAESLLIDAGKTKKSPLFLFELCDLYRRELKLKKASKACDSGRKLTQQYVPGQISYIKLKIALGAFNDAENILQNFSKKAGNPEIGMLKVRTALGQKKTKIAREELNRWIAKPDTDAFQLLLLDGEIRFMNHHFSKAVGFLEQAHKNKPLNAEAAVFYAQTLSILGDPNKSLAILRKTKQHAIWGGMALLAEGNAKRLLHKADSALESFDKAKLFFKKNPPLPEVYSTLYTERALANQLKYGWNHEAVRKDFDSARRFGDPNNAFYNLHRGRYFLNIEIPNLSRAKSAFRKVLLSEPDNCRALSNLIAIINQTKGGKSKRMKTRKRKYVKAKKKYCRK